MKSRYLVLVLATALVVALSYVGFSDRADAYLGVYRGGARIDAAGVPVDTAELARLITSFEADVHRVPTPPG